MVSRARVLQRLALARLTRDIHAPLANRLGIWQLKWELEDLAFRYLEPAGNGLWAPVTLHRASLLSFYYCSAYGFHSGSRLLRTSISSAPISPARIASNNARCEGSKRRLNPMAAATGHRICNDCMKSCIYQKQEPVNIPQIETGVLTDVLALPWGVEIYGLLTRWNPLNVRRPYALPYNGKNVMVVGLGPAGYTLSHYLLNEGFGVVGIDGLKIEPLPRGSGSSLIQVSANCPRPVRGSRRASSEHRPAVFSINFPAESAIHR